MRVKGTKANRRFTYDANKGLEAETEKARKELEKRSRQHSANIYAGRMKKLKKNMRHTNRE